MKVAIVGAGGVGGYFGGLLARAGHDVTFVARGAHLDAIKRNGGLRVESQNDGDFFAARQRYSRHCRRRNARFSPVQRQDAPQRPRHRRPSTHGWAG